MGDAMRRVRAPFGGRLRIVSCETCGSITRTVPLKRAPGRQLCQSCKNVEQAREQAAAKRTGKGSSTS